MSCILRITNFPSTGNEADVRNYLAGFDLSTVLILGGPDGLVFVTLTRYSDCYVALLRHNNTVKGHKVKIYRSNYEELRDEVEKICPRYYSDKNAVAGNMDSARRNKGRKRLRVEEYEITSSSRRLRL